MSNTYRPFALRVLRRAQLSPTFIRITFTGADLDRCADVCLDQRVKLVFAAGPVHDQLEAASADPDFDWFGWWRALPDDGRPPMRTYTLRDVRTDRREIDIDFACHGSVGPASSFALHAQPGDEVIMIGPDAEVPGAAESGLAWRPGDARNVLLVGDETAVPAICGIVESLGPTVRGEALCEVESTADVLPVHTRSAVRMRWLTRGSAPIGSALILGVRDWIADRGARLPDVPTAPDPDDLDEPDETDDLVWEEADGPAETYAWLAGEATTITGLRRTLIDEAGFDRRGMSFMGYWRAGRASLG